jgi:3-oxoadipate enol-lactonase
MNHPTPLAPHLLPRFTALGAGPTVLMLHGIGGGHLAFAPQVESLAQAGYRAVAWDMPGYGHSAPVEPYTFKALAERCMALIESLMGGPRPLILLGHSMGGMVAQEVVARRPGLVSRLILCGTSPAFGRSDGEWQSQFVASRTAPLDAGHSMADLAASLVPAMVGLAALPAGVQLAQHCMGQVSAATYRRALQCLMGFDRRAQLGAIRVPTLVLAGQHDPNAPPAVMRAMAGQISGSRYVELAGVGHLHNLEDPDGFDGAVLDFLANAAINANHFAP